MLPQPPPTSPSPRHARIGVIGDIHTAFHELRWAVTTLRAQQVEQIFATGDIVDGPCTAHGVVRACALLQEFGVISVLGNHDRWLLDEQQRDRPDATSAHEVTPEARAYLQRLPASIEVNTPGGLMLLGHGLGSNDMSALYPHDHGPSLRNNSTLQQLLRRGRHRFVVSGHTHLRMVRRLEGVTFVNAGALCYTRHPCCVVLDFAELRAQFHDYPTPDAHSGLSPGPTFDL